MTESADEPLFPATDPIAPGASPPPTATAAADAGVPDRPARPRRPAAKRPALDADVDADADAEGVTRAAVDAAPDSIEADALAAPAASMPMALDPPHAERPTEAPTAPTRRRRGASKGPSEVFAPVSPPDTDAAAEATDATDATAAAADVPDTAVSMSSVASRDLSEADVDDTMAAGATPDTRQLTPTPPAPQEPPLQVGDLFAQVLSGAFDVSAEPPPDAAATPPKRVLLPEPEAPKLHKVLAQAGVGSRRDMEQMIADGLVTVNGQPAHTGQRISFGDRIAVDGKPVKVRIQPLPARLIAYHKPAGEVVSHDDPQQRPTVFRRLPRLQQGKWQSVGRLDLNTEGLLLFTNNGQLANQLMHPRFGVEREYAVRLHGRVDPAASAKLLEGVELDGQACSFRSIEDGGGDGANHWYRVVITEGRNREVRRLFEAVGLTVSRLIRIRYGSVVLPRGLKRGVWVDLSDTDLRAVRQLVAAGQRQGGEAGQAPAERTPGEPRPPRPQQEPRPRRDGREPRPPYQPQGQQPPRGNGPRPGPGPRPPAVSFDHIDRPVPFDDDVDPDFEEEIDHARIPNPLEQTFDKRFVQNPRGPAGGRGFGQGGGGFGAGGSAPRGGGAPGGRKGPGAPREPDPMQTSVGYIGGDAFLRKANRGNGGGGGSGGNRGGGGGGPRGGNGGPRGGGGGGGGGFRGR